MGWRILPILAAVSLFAQTPKARHVDFDREIRPILSDNCFACHGPDERQRMAGLRFDIKEGAFLDRGKYKIIEPGNAAQSRLFQRIAATAKALRMPPPGSGHSLTDHQIQLIRDWIDQGAAWETHWAYVKPKRPAIPPVKGPKWVRNPIDNFVLARLESENLKPSPEADKTTLLRRLSFDLTGLPPSIEEIDAFLKDKSPAAYEKQVDRLLQSPHYGERMAMPWLDLARYADTHGYHIDSHRVMWPWRDWVISAFNRNMPYDEFTVEQIAGDMLPGATDAQRIATGFNRNHMINFEGGAIPEEYQLEYVVDRIEATATTWLGMTMGCARCHDHKYDPIKQKDFYSFAAFFNTIPEEGLDGRDGNAKPMLRLPSPGQAAEEKDLKDKIQGLQSRLPDAGLALLQAAWETNRRESLIAPSRDGLLVHYEFDGSLADTSGHYRHARAVKGEATFPAGPVNRSVSFDGLTRVDFGDAPSLDKSRAFSLALWMKANSGREMDVLARVEDSATRRGYELRLGKSEALPHLREASHLYFRLTHKWPGDAIEIQSRDLFITGKWYAVAVTYDGSGKGSGLRLYIDGQAAEFDLPRDSLAGSIGTAKALEVGDGAISDPYKGQLDDLRIYGRVLEIAEVRQLALQEPARATLFLPVLKRSREQKARLQDYFLRFDAPQGIRTDYAELGRLNARFDDLEKSILNTMVMKEMDSPRSTNILGRGDYRNRGERVSPNVPAILPPLPKDAPRNRLGLAQWLVSPENPLTARVAVNHFWQMYFGLGLVKTAEDFGVQGDAPSHPELLDWLATEFVRTGWDVRAMQKLIVTSATYRQSSRVSPELHERDPENRLLARGPRFRLPAEMVRDNALAISGLLNGKIGGASVFPPQPGGLWEEIAYGGVFSAQKFVPSHGSDLYRRGMYTFWKRTSSPPALTTFDAPNREKCVARRAVTNTPLQALALENDPAYFEAARVLAERTIREAGRNPDQRIVYAFRAATARKPTAKEIAILRDVARDALTSYRGNPGRAREIISVGESRPDRREDPGELATWTNVASVILNLDETITKE